MTTLPQDAVLAWHFLSSINGEPRLSHGDGRLVVQGETLSVKGTPRLCAYGLHASVKALDALSSTDGDVFAQRVWVRGALRVGEDKLCGQQRHCIALLSAEQTRRVLQEFALWCAARALKRKERLLEATYFGRGGRAPDTRSEKALMVAALYLEGKATRQEVNAAVAAADAAHAGFAADDAVRYALRAVLQPITRVSTVIYAAWDAAWEATDIVAWEAEREAQNARLERKLLDAMGLAS